MARNVKITQNRKKKKVKFEISVGIFLFRKENEKIFWLLLHYPAGHWDFVKGHIEKNEKIEETIRREVFEETGIKNFQIYPNFQKSITYWFNNQKYTGKKEWIYKKVIFLLGETKESDIRLSPEHTEAKWMTTNEASKTITFANTRKIFLQAVELITNRQKSAKED
ncbi:MAG: bis(5'-nucleosyl)-tetraphosphatase [Minisyncoccia bacterium]